MLQGSWLGPLSLIFGAYQPPQTRLLSTQNVDDTTLTELLYDRTKPSSMQSFCH